MAPGPGTSSVIGGNAFGTPGLAFLVILSDTCQVLTQRTFELGDMARNDTFFGVTPDGSGGYFAFGQEGDV